MMRAVCIPDAARRARLAASDLCLRCGRDRHGPALCERCKHELGLRPRVGIKRHIPGQAAAA